MAVRLLSEEEIRSNVRAELEVVQRELHRHLPEARIEHVGATAVPGSLTKGDLDLCVLVSGAEFAHAEQVLSRIATRNLDSVHTPFFAAFCIEGHSLPVGVQLVELHSPYDFFVRWRELLRTEPATLREYNALKLRCSSTSDEEYRAAKGRFIEERLHR